MSDVATINAKALAFTRAQPTEILVGSWKLTDEAMKDASGDDRLVLAESRGWIMDVLEERGELHVIGICGGCFSDLDTCDC